MPDDKNFPGFIDDGKQTPKPKLDLGGDDGDTQPKKRQIARPGAGDTDKAKTFSTHSDQREQVLRDDAPAESFPGFHDDGKTTPKPSIDFEADEPEMEISASLLPDSSAHTPAVSAPPMRGADDDGAADYDGSSRAARKDLWICPHCGAKNKPSRNTCRTCDKSPREKVARPWFLQPHVLGGIAGGILVIVLLAMWLMKPNYGMKAARAGNIDNAARMNHDGGSELSCDTGIFLGEGLFAICGRVANIKTNEAGEVTEIAIALSDKVTNKADASQLSDDGNRVGKQSKQFGTFIDVPFVRLIPVNHRKDLATVKHLDLFSLAGQHGSVKNGETPDPSRNRYVVYINQYANTSD